MLINSAFLKLNRTPLLLTVSCLLLYISFAYHLTRTDYTKLIMLYTALFFLFYKLVQILKHNISLLTWIAFGFRTVFILAIPNLSQDFYRFIWDGNMILVGFNPYLTTPDFQMNLGILSGFPNQIELQKGMGALNSSHFTNYPPINQLCFVLANFFPGQSILSSVIGLRLIIIIADFGTLYFGKKILKKLRIPAHNIFWYILNPFIIIELTGNLHFEGVMIFFLIWSMYLLFSGKWQWAAVVLALSISIKLIPLIFLPLFFQWFMKRSTISSERRDETLNCTSTKPMLSSRVQDDTEIIARSKRRGNLLKKIPAFAGITKLIGFYAIVVITTILLFAPFYSSEFINNYAQTVGLWFQNFEFNASIYYVAREIGYLFRGYNEIAIIGKITPIIVILFVITMAFFRKNKTTIELITAMLLVLSFYYFTTTTVHPWYVATLLILSIFTKYKFPLVWSFVIILSYLAYINLNKADKSENLWIIGLEYVIVYGVFIWEVFIKKKSPQTSFKSSIL